ncbi:MAG: hypothetical protein NUV76_07925 [Candidatus Kuenenia sp.]|nr:hypothetical protein [Candidatus Kuenenia sp.]
MVEGCSMFHQHLFIMFFTLFVAIFCSPAYANGKASLKQPAGYIPITMQEYMGARKILKDMTKAEFTKWKAKHLKTPEEIIQKYWSTIRRKAKKQKIHTDVLAAVLLNEMRAINNKDFNNDLYYFDPLWETLGPGGIEIDKLKGQYPSIGIAQLRVDTVMKRKLIPMFMSKKERKFLKDTVKFPGSDNLNALNTGQMSKVAASLIDPEFSIRTQAAHVAQMTAKIDKTVWGIQDANGNTIGFPAKLLRDPSKLTPVQRKAFIFRLIKNYTHRKLTPQEVKSFLDSGAAYFMLIGAMIDDYWEDQSNPNFAPFRFKVPWGNGIWESFKDIGSYLLKNPPDWKGFLKNRRVYDEDGEYGPKGQVIPLPDDLKVSFVTPAYQDEQGIIYMITLVNHRSDLQKAKQEIKDRFFNTEVQGEVIDLMRSGRFYPYHEFEVAYSQDWANEVAYDFIPVEKIEYMETGMRIFWRKHKEVKTLLGQLLAARRSGVDAEEIAHIEAQLAPYYTMRIFSAIGGETIPLPEE